MTDLRERLGPNAVLPCGSDARRRTHWATGEICVVCEPGVEWLGRCPFCSDRVTVAGVHVQPHSVDDEGVEFQCPGAGQVVSPPKRRTRALTTAGAVGVKASPR